MVNPYADTLSGGVSRQLGADMAINVDAVYLLKPIVALAGATPTLDVLSGGVEDGLGRFGQAVGNGEGLVLGQRIGVDARDAGGRVDGVDLPVVAPRQPEHFAVRGHAAHIRTAARRDLPRRGDLPRGQIDQRDRAFPAIRDVEHLRIPADVQAVRPLPRPHEPHAREARAVDEVHAVGHHVGDVERSAVGRQLHVLDLEVARCEDHGRATRGRHRIEVGPAIHVRHEDNPVDRGPMEIGPAIRAGHRSTECLGRGPEQPAFTRQCARHPEAPFGRMRIEDRLRGAAGAGVAGTGRGAVADLLAALDSGA